MFLLKKNFFCLGFLFFCSSLKSNNRTNITLPLTTAAVKLEKEITTQPDDEMSKEKKKITAVVKGYFWAHFVLQLSMIFGFSGIFLLLQNFLAPYFHKTDNYLLKRIGEKWLSIPELTYVFSSLFFYLFLFSYAIISTIIGEEDFFKSFFCQLLNFVILFSSIILILAKENFFDVLNYLYRHRSFPPSINQLDKKKELFFLLLVGYAQFLLYKVMKHILQLKKENWSEPVIDLKSKEIELTERKPS